MDVKSARGDAHLAVVAEFAGDRDLGHHLRVGVGQDDERGVPAEFEAEPFDLVGRGPHELLADFGRSGKRNLANGRVLEELVGDFLGRADDQVSDAGRQAGVDHALKDLHQAKRGLARRLADDGAARRESRGDLAGLQRDREIPRADGADDADGMLDDEMAFAGGRVRDHLPVGPFAFFREPFERVGGVQDFALSLGQRLALFQRHGASDGVDPVAHQLGRLLQDLGTIVDGAAHPIRHGPVCRRDGPLGFGSAAECHLGDDFLGGGVDDAQCPAIVGRDPFAVD